MNRGELARVMQAGSKRPGVVEDSSYHISAKDNQCLVCALGAGVIELYGGDFKTAHDDFMKRYDQRLNDPLKYLWGLGTMILAEMLGIDHELAADVSYLHEVERQTIAEIAAWLESSGGQEARA